MTLLDEYARLAGLALVKANRAEDPELRAAFRDQARQIIEELDRLTAIMRMLDEDPPQD